MENIEIYVLGCSEPASKLLNAIKNDNITKKVLNYFNKVFTKDCTYFKYNDFIRVMECKSIKDYMGNIFTGNVLNKFKTYLFRAYISSVYAKFHQPKKLIDIIKPLKEYDGGLEDFLIDKLINEADPIPPFLITPDIGAIHLVGGFASRTYRNKKYPKSGIDALIKYYTMFLKEYDDHKSKAMSQLIELLMIHNISDRSMKRLLKLYKLLPDNKKSFLLLYMFNTGQLDDSLFSASLKIVGYNMGLSSQPIEFFENYFERSNSNKNQLMRIRRFLNKYIKENDALSSVGQIALSMYKKTKNKKDLNIFYNAYEIMDETDREDIKISIIVNWHLLNNEEQERIYLLSADKDFLPESLKEFLLN